MKFDRCLKHDFFYYSVDSVCMKRGLMASAVVVLMILGCFIPLMQSDESEAIDHDDYKISIPFADISEIVPIVMENGATKTFSIYITNYSAHVLDVAFTAFSDVSYLYSETSESVTIMPAGDSEGRDFVKVYFKIITETITSSHNGGRVFLQIHIADVEDESVFLVPVSFSVKVNSNFDTSGTYNRFFGIIDNTLPEPFDSPYVPFFVTLLGVIVMGFVVVRVLIPIVTRYATENKERTKKILTLGVLIVSILLFLDPGLRILGSDLSLILQVQKISMTALIIVLAITIWKIYMILVESVLKRLGQDKESAVDMTFLPIFSMIGKFVLWVGGIASILHVYGFDLTGILISAGIVTLGITMGAQSVLSQLFNGISILLTRPFSEGDYLLIDGEVYVVKQVKLMYTEFTSYEKDRIITIPNDKVAGATIVNMSKYDRAYRMQILFEIPYGEDLEKVERVILEMAEESKHVMHNYNKYKKPVVKLMDFQDSGILMRLDITVMDFAKYQTIQSDMKKELYLKLAEEGIEMPYSRLEVTILNNQNDAAGA